MVITAPNIMRRAGERVTRAEAGVEAEGAGAEVGVGVEVGVEEAGEGGVAAGEYGSQPGVYILPLISILVFIKKTVIFSRFYKKNWEKLGFFAKKRPNLAQNCHF